MNSPMGWARQQGSGQRGGNMRHYTWHAIEANRLQLPRKHMETRQAQIIDLAAIATQASANETVGAIWSLVSTDLNLNVLHFGDGDGVAAHINNEVDVLGLVIAGEGVLDLDGRQERLQPGLLFFIPKGARRSITSRSSDFTYLSCHRRRAGLMPTRAERKQE
jgi:mannose-6-phosphate isomerase-like protein (cupin superfamily)